MKVRNWLFLRGLARESRHWGDFPKRFEERFSGTKTFFLDLPGAGKKHDQLPPSTIGLYTDSLRKEWRGMREDEKEDWGVISISMGSMIAMDWCSRYPDDFKSLVVMNTTARNFSLPHERLRVKALMTLSQLFLSDDDEKREYKILKLTTELNEMKDELIQKYAAFAKEFPIQKISFLKQIYAASKFKAPKVLPIPLLVLAGKKDALASYKCSKKLAKHYLALFSLHEQAGHDLCLDDPEWVLAELAHFLDFYEL